MVESIDSVFRDFNTPGNPASGEYKPEKPRIRALLKQMQGSSGLSITKGTRAALNAVTPPNENYMGVVLADPNPANNGYYYRSGGTWVKGRGFPDAFARLTVTGGTANNVQAAVDTGVAPADVEVFYIVPSSTNTGSVSLSISGGMTKNVLRVDGSVLTAGEWPAGRVLLLADFGAAYRLLSDPAVDALLQQAIDILDDATQLTTPGDNTVSRPKLSDGLKGGIGFSPTEFGAIGNGVADDTDAVNAAMTAAGYSGRLFLEAGKTFLTSVYSNLKGALIDGPGQLVTAVTGGFWQRNTYANLMYPHLGHENINRVYQYFNLGQGTSLGTAYIRIFGDSTATNNYGDYGPDAVIRRAFAYRGLPNIIVQNLAVSGTRWDQFDPTGQITGTALFIISYGVNDPANGSTLDERLAALYANMDAKLSALRALANVGTLGIILKMPNSTSDSPNNRDERWYEKIRTIYVEMARKYDCALFDTYGQFWNSRTAAGKWMDDPYGDGRAIHPASAMNNWVWGRLIDEFFPIGAISLYATNMLTNDGGTTSNLSHGALPSAFSRGIGIFRATTGNGWPVDGFVRVTKNVDGGVLQELFNYANGSTRVMCRTAYITGDSWNPWSGLAAAIPLSNGWVNTGGSYAAPTATRDASGRVFVEGMISSGTTAAGTTVGVLPSGYRPSVIHQFTSLAQTSLVGLAVHSNGNIVLQTSGNATSTSLGGIHFMAA